MNLVFTALAALAAALLDLSVAPHFRFSGAQPHLVLVLGVVATVVIGPATGLAWAFAGGIALDVLAGRPLGATAFTLLVVLGSAGLGARVDSRLRPLVAIGLVPIGSASSSLLLVVVLGLLGPPVAGPDPGSLLAGIAYDTAVAILVVPVVMMVVDRRGRAGNVYA
jgi:rod shape-determining protein MreD